DNTCGATPQPNAWAEQWVTFLRERRLLHQLELAAGKGGAANVVDRGRTVWGLLGAFYCGSSTVHLCVCAYDSLRAIARCLRSCTAIFGAATGAPMRTACRSSSIRPCITAT